MRIPYFYKWYYLVLFIIGIILIIVGSILKYTSPPIIGDISSLVGAMASIVALLSGPTRENQEQMLELLRGISRNQEQMSGLLREIRDRLAGS